MKTKINLSSLYSIKPTSLNDFTPIINPIDGCDFKCNDTTLVSLAQYLNILPDSRDDLFNDIWEIRLIKHKNKTVGITGYYVLADEPNIPWLTWFGIIKSYQNYGLGSYILEQTLLYVKRTLPADFMKVYCIDDIVPFYLKNNFQLLGKAKDIGLTHKCESETDNVLICDLKQLKETDITIIPSLDKFFDNQTDIIT